MITGQIDPDFVENATVFLEEGLRKGGSALLIAAQGNAQAISARLDKWLKARPGCVVTVDAVPVLGRLAVDGIPDELNFHATIDALIAAVEPPATGTIRVVSEIAALADRLSTRAVSAVVANLWQDLTRRHGQCEFMVDFAGTIKLGTEELAELGVR